MMYGCIGEHLVHSYSAEIHPLISSESYVLRELSPQTLPAFMTEANFKGINVTIPYKQAVIPYLSKMDDTARAIGAVNTIINKGGRLYGYNTDEYGLRCLFEKTGIDPRGRKVLILGTGGTSKTACYAMRVMGAEEIRQVSRSGKEGALTYEEAAETCADAEIIVNTTPCGMYPHQDEQPISLDSFPNLKGVIDVIYNPLRTRLVLDAQARGIPAAGGLYMLVAQAVRAAGLFRNTVYQPALIDMIYGKLRRVKENVVLIGMPGAGKSRIGQELSNLLQRELLDTDEMVESAEGKKIAKIFAKKGEDAFRKMETGQIEKLADRIGVVISTGGGAVLNPENVISLKQNGRLFFLKRDPSEIEPSDKRPLADTREKIAKLWEKRLPVYLAAADEIIPVQGQPEETAAAVEKRWREI